MKVVVLAALVALGFGLGVLAGLEWADRPGIDPPIAPPPIPDEPDPPGPDLGVRPSPPAPVCPDSSGLQGELDDARRRIENLQARLALAQVVERGYRGELYGTPVPWPDEVPEHLSARGFQAILAQSLDACQVPAELIDFACDEAPCLAMLRPAKIDWIWSLIRDCPTWGERFRRVPLQHDFWVTCGDRSERVVVLAPFWKDFPGDRQAMLKRLAARVEQIRSGWQCGP